MNNIRDIEYENKKNIYIVDFDSCKIMGNKPSPSKYLTPMALLNAAGRKYKEILDSNILADYEVDENTDLYCYIIIILNFLYGENINNIGKDDFSEYLNYLNDLNMDLNLIDCFDRIVSNVKNINPMDYIETLTSEQIYKAKKKVYQARNR